MEVRADTLVASINSGVCHHVCWRNLQTSSAGSRRRMPAHGRFWRLFVCTWYVVEHVLECWNAGIIIESQCVSQLRARICSICASCTL